MANKLLPILLLLPILACSLFTPKEEISIQTSDKEIELTVAANQGWQDTGVQLNSGERVLIEYLSGQITDREEIIVDGTGSDYVCGQSECCEPMAEERRSSLIGRIGRIDDEIFYIGNGVEITSAAEGTLFLRINDCNSGLHDNAGEFVVRVKIASPENKYQ